MSVQLDYLNIYRGKSILIGGTSFIDSYVSNGELFYYADVKSLNDGNVSQRNDCTSYKVSDGTGCGALIKENKMIVGTDRGNVCVYTVDVPEPIYAERYQEDDTTPSFFNNTSVTAHSSCVLSLSVNKSSTKFITSGMDRRILVWDTETLTTTTSIEFAHVDNVTSSRFYTITKDDSESSNTFLSISLDGTCILWDLRAKKNAKMLIEEEEKRFKCVEWFEKDPNYLFLGCDYGYIRMIDVRKPNEMVFEMHTDEGCSINAIRARSYNKKKYLSVCADSDVFTVYECNENSLSPIYVNDSHNDYVKDTFWLPNNDLITCSWDSCVQKHSPFRTIPGCETATKGQ